MAACLESRYETVLYSSTPFPTTSPTCGSTSPLDDGGKSTKNEWLGLIDIACLELETLASGFAGEPLTDDAGEYVFVARRPSWRYTAARSRR